MLPKRGGTPAVRIADADREHAAERLHRAMAEGRISVEELEERLALVHASRYAADLVPALADLPGGAQEALPSGQPLVLRAGASGLKRAGRWSVPASIQVRSSMGSVHLDFCDTAIVRPVVDIDLRLGAGSAKLLLPDGATADVDELVASMGRVKSAVSARRTSTAPHFVIRGRTMFGSVEIRKRRSIAGIKF
ncbi:DUF1707 domain-containing protein [Conexibacter sp. W3-3-2]|uniref:DUF1707 SHOCT-like domain-containing protein n=1 Tax=Conexibacter sp. W3-3-2 TaxID=2675227 RepID=UPI0012B7A689|nr:DUF1707 domain-containing protein [Conexibacter sp. W3-3-2]MTD47318.1 DUF1707 domain-containing protein [Conexibacter sp. W3-3-2]